jgi:CBS domain-containing protein
LFRGIKMLVKDVIKSVEIHTIPSDISVHEAAVRMSELNIGALIVGSPEKIEGIFSERDILKKVIAMDLSPENIKVRDVMSNEITMVEDTESAHNALNIMKHHNFRHLPVINEKGVCVGVIGIRNLMKYISENLETDNKALSRHIIDDKNWE